MPLAAAAAAARLTVPSGSLADALNALGRQAGVDIGSSDPAISAIRVKGFTAGGSFGHVLARLLASTPFEAQQIGAGTWRIVRRTAPPVVAQRAAPPKPRAAVPGGDIVVVASKREQPLSSFPGGTIIVRASDDAFGPIGAEGEHWLLQRTPILQSTELGSGRNKLFIRGIADSSFTGPTQSTVSTYFGGVRIGYNGPDPNLNLYDVDQVEILEGPQGTLYGAGAIGGIISLSPRAPDLHSTGASAQIGLSGTEHGGIGYDGAAMVNVAPWTDRFGVRLVGYRSRQSGFISTANGNRAINPLTQTGGRVSARARPIHGLTLDFTFLRQNSEQPDLQYANPAVGNLKRIEALAQPFADHFQLIRGVAEQRFGHGWVFQVAGARIDHDTSQRYDATRVMNAPIAYDEEIDIGLTTIEAHVAHTASDGSGQLVGISGVWDITSAGRTYGSLAAPRDLIGVSNRTKEKAAYAEWTQAIGASTALTVGGRYTSARMDGEPSRTPTNSDFIRGRTTDRLDPEFGFTHKLGSQLQWFGQYSQGFRTGGLAVARGAGRVASYDADSVRVGQTGVRLFRDGSTGFGGYAEVSYAYWSDIQADLVAANGFPFTANVGNGRILTFEASGDWVVTPAWRLRGSVVLTRSRLVDPQPEFANSDGRALPASPSVTATGRIDWKHIFWGKPFRADLHMRYVGRSRLGVGSVLDIPYGNYTEFGSTAAIKLGHFEASLGIENLLNADSNRFAIGNPFAVALRNEATPLRPRTYRLGLSTAF